MPLTSIHRNSCYPSARRGRVFVKGFDYYGNLIVDDEKKTRRPTSPPTTAANKKWNTSIRNNPEDDNCSEFLVDETPNTDNDANINPSCVGEFFTCFQLNVKDLATCAEQQEGGVGDDDVMTATAAYHAGRADAYMTAAAAAMSVNTPRPDSYYVPPTPALAASGGQQYYHASPIDYPYGGGGSSQKSPIASAAAMMYYPPPRVMQQLPVRME